MTSPRENGKEAIKTGELHDEARGVTIRWQAFGYHLEFQAREGTKQDDGSICYQYFNEQGGQEFTDDFARAERFVDGSVKWDGCSHVNFGDENGYLHQCGGYGFRALHFVLTKVAELAATECPAFDETVARFKEVSRD